MAAYDNLRAVIAANVYQNNENKVTADMVKTAMNEMVNSLGAEYQFGGVAEPDDNPGTPDYKVAYLAATPGTYTDFGGIVVADGEVVNLKWDGTSWSKDTTGAATTAALAELANLTIVHNYEERQAASVEDKRFNADGSLSDSTQTKLYTFNVIGGGKYAFSGRMPSSITNYFIAWYDANNVFIDKEPYKGVIGSAVEYDHQEIIAPNNAAYAKMNVYNTQASRAHFYSSAIRRTQEIADNALYRDDVVDSLDSANASAPLSAKQGANLNTRLNELEYDARKKTFTELASTIVQNSWCHNGIIASSSNFDIYTYTAIDPTKVYSFSGSMRASFTADYIEYFDENDVYIGRDIYRGSLNDITSFTDRLLHIPSNAAIIRMNVLHGNEQSYRVCSVELGAIGQDAATRAIKLVVRENNSFYARFHLDETRDAILDFDFFGSHFVNNSIGPRGFAVGQNTDTDEDIMAGAIRQSCSDVYSAVFTDNFGPLFSNHGLSTPRVNIPNHGLLTSDLGSIWVDQNGYHYELIHIDGNWLYLFPVINDTGVPGYETREWKYYNYPYPTEITRDAPGGETLMVDSAGRWDYQISELDGTRVMINGNKVGEGVYYVDEFQLAARQVGYNPSKITTWWPSPVYNGKMLVFDRVFTVSGGFGSLALTLNTVYNNLYPYPLGRYVDVQPQFPYQIGQYLPYIFIPKVKKTTEGVDFREEFVSPSASEETITIQRTSTDLYDVDKMPDRAYCYLKNGDGNILFGCAGGHSLVRGLSVPSAWNNNVGIGENVCLWMPSAGNKFYSRLLMQTGEVDNMLPSSFIGEFEGYMCWYMPRNGVQVFYHRTKEGYVVYIHTDTTAAKGEAVLPDFMNNYAVAQIVEKTADIDLLTGTIIDGKIYFANDSSVNKYNYIVFLVKP